MPRDTYEDDLGPVVGVCEDVHLIAFAHSCQWHAGHTCLTSSSSSHPPLTPHPLSADELPPSIGRFGSDLGGGRRGWGSPDPHEATSSRRQWWILITTNPTNSIWNLASIMQPFLLDRKISQRRDRSWSPWLKQAFCADLLAVLRPPLPDTDLDQPLAMERAYGPFAGSMFVLAFLFAGLCVSCLRVCH
jgi:hypothetical protein